MSSSSSRHCHSKCDKCGLMCRKANKHKDTAHDCFTDHKCHSKCQLSESHTGETLPECTEPAAHQGLHKCGQFHKCNAACIYRGKRNCKSKCAKVFGHQEDETHLCESSSHYCGAPCSLIVDTKNGKYNCPDKCDVNIVILIYLVTFVILFICTNTLMVTTTTNNSLSVKINIHYIDAKIKDVRFYALLKVVESSVELLIIFMR